MGNKNMSITISFELYHLLEEHCRKNNISHSKLISKAIESEILDDEPYNPDDLVFNRYDNVLIDMGKDLSKIKEKFTDLKLRIERLEDKHLIGSHHTLRDEF